MGKGYCTVTDVRNALTPSGLESDRETAANLPDEQIQDQIDEAEGIVDTYLNNRYQIILEEIEVEDPDNPGNTLVWLVAPVPVRGLTRNIAAFLSALVYRKNKDLAEDDPIRLRYTLSMDLLEKVLSGKIVLPLPTNETPPQGVEIFNPYEGDLFTMCDVGLGYETSGKQVYWPYQQWVM